MQAQFHITGDLEVLVATAAGGVEVEIVEGAYFGVGEDSRTIKRLALTKPVARAVASAIMGCAAES